jgi:ferredoxin-NADP reductase
MSMLRMRVVHTELMTPTVRRVLFESSDQVPLPSFSAGAHIGLRVPICRQYQRRAYSLVNSTGPRTHYEIAVHLEPESSGGSRWVHTLDIGMEVDVEIPRNDFPMVDFADDTLLIAGGIGITPILSMARELSAGGKRFRLHYAARDASSMAYREEVLGLENAVCWLNGKDPRNRIPLERVIGQPQPHSHIYVCGPAGLVQAARATAHRLGWPEAQIHSELFASALPDKDTDQAFEVELASSGLVLNVPMDRSIVDVMLEAGLDPLFDCRRGDCGVCATRLIAGIPDHRDICLSQGEHSEGQFCPCVSRAKSNRIVLDV